MRSLLAFVLCAASFVALHAQDAPDPSNPADSAAVQKKPSASKPVPPLPIGRVAGTVFCADTHRPARGALIMLAAKPGQIDNTSLSRVGMDGSYAFEHISPGEYAVVAALPGYLNPFEGAIFTPTRQNSVDDQMWKRESAHGTLKVTAGEALKFDIELQRGAAISGRVLYSDGAPATQIVIETQNIARDKEKIDSRTSVDISGMVQGMARQSLSTDDVGHFRLSGLLPGTYRVLAVQLSRDHANDSFDGAAAINDPSAVRVYAGDTLHQKAAKTYDLRAGEETTDIDITIPVEAFHSVRGHVSAVDGRSINMADLELSDPSDATFSMSTQLQRDGSFNFPSVPLGTYTLRVTGARIGELPGQSEDATTLVEKIAFGDNTQSIVVADADLADVNVSLTEVPMPKPTASPR